MENEVITTTENLPAVRQPSIFESPERFELAEKIAGYLSRSKDMIPVNFQNSPENCVIALNLADRMGVDVMALMQSMHVIHGKPGLDGKFIIALVNQSGQFKEPLDFIFEGSGNDAKCTCKAERINGKLCEATVTWQMVVQEGWASKPGSKWKTMPDQMFTYRSASFFARRYCPGLLLGMRSSDEWEDIGPTKVTGHVIDTQTTETKPETKAEKPVYEMKKAPKPTDAKPEKKEPVSVMPNDAKTARGTGWDKPQQVAQAADTVQDATEAETKVDTPPVDKVPENATSSACMVAFGYQVGGDYALWSEKLQKAVTVKVVSIDATDQAAPIFHVERSVAGVGQGEFRDVTLAAMQTKPPLDENGMSTDPAVEADRQAAEKSLAEKNNAEPIKVEEMNRLKETGMQNLISDPQRMAVTPAEVKEKIWEKFYKYNFNTDNQEYLNWKEFKAMNEASSPAKFTNQPTDLIGDDPEHKAIKKIHAWIKEKGFDDAGVKLAMRQFNIHDKEAGKIRPFDFDSRNMIQLQHVKHFETLLEDIAPCHALATIIHETEKIAGKPGGFLMDKAMEFAREFSPKITGKFTHLYELLYQPAIRDQITDKLDEWCAEDTATAKPEPPEQQSLSDLPILSNFGSAVNFAASIAKVEVNDDFATIVRAFFKEVFDAGPVQIANALPTGTAEKINSDFAGFYAAKIG